MRDHPPLELRVENTRYHKKPSKESLFSVLALV